MREVALVVRLSAHAKVYSSASSEIYVAIVVVVELVVHLNRHTYEMQFLVGMNAG